MSKYRRIKDFLEENPETAPKEAASELGCSVSKVLRAKMELDDQDEEGEVGFHPGEKSHIVYYVQTCENGWEIKQHNSSRQEETCNSKQEAVERAKQIAEENMPSEVWVRKQSGEWDTEYLFEGEKKEDREQFQQEVEEYGKKIRKMRNEISNVIVGQEDAVENVLLSLMCDGNILLEGVPGLGKSLLIETLAQVVSDADFNRIQFVPDMLPSDILGQRVYNQKKGDFYINKGPVFTNFLLADEINRAPPKTQAALMEVMQEQKVSIEKESFDLEPPYLVLATQNPLEQKGTYPLPEAVIDRFFMKLRLDYPEEDEEQRIVRKNSLNQTDIFSPLDEVVSKDEILEIQEIVRGIYISEKVEEYIIRIVNYLRDNTDKKIETLKYIDYGPSPRASIWLSMGASANAVMEGRTFVTPEDVKEVAQPVLRHRVLLNYEGKIRDITTDQVIESVLDYVETV